MHGEALEPGIRKQRIWQHARPMDRCMVNCKRKIIGEFFEQQYIINELKARVDFRYLIYMIAIIGIYFN